MDKWCALMQWSSTREALVLHWKIVVSLTSQDAETFNSNSCQALLSRANSLSCILVVVSVVVVAVICCCTTPTKSEPTTACDSSGSSSHEIPDTCPWQLVMSDLTHRLRLLEMAFKEQVIAREVMAAEVTNQSYSNLELERKLDEFVSAIKQLSHRLDKLKEQMSELSSRLYSDECLGFLVLLFVTVQIILALRTKLRSKQDQGQGIKGLTTQPINGSTVNVPRSLSNNSINGISLSPKQSVSFKQDACAITFSKGAWEKNSAQNEMLLAHVTEGIKFPIKQSYVIDSQEALKECPRAKVYLVLVDCQCLTADDSGGENGGNGGAGTGLEHQPDLDFQMTSVRLLHLSGGHVILVLTNDRGSQQLSDHALYNTSLPFIHSYDVLQELASNGRVISIWKDFSSYQLSHIKKIGRSILSNKGK